MKKVVPFVLLVLFLVSFSAAIPTSRSFKSSRENFAANDLIDQTHSQSTVQQLQNAEELFREGRIDFETTDYSGAGANTHHDPKSPGSTLT